MKRDPALADPILDNRLKLERSYLYRINALESALENALICGKKPPLCNSCIRTGRALLAKSNSVGRRKRNAAKTSGGT